MENEIEHIESRHGALIWAIGCVWAAYVERYWNKTRSAASTTVSAIALLVVVPFSLAFLAWYMVSLRDLGLATGVTLGSARLALGLSVMVLAGAAAPGQWQWRTMAGTMFPFLAFGAFLATAYIGLQASDSVNSLVWPHGWLWFCLNYGIAGIVFGVTMGGVLSLPFSLVYRSRAALLATLALMPEFAMFIWHLSERKAVAHHNAVMTFIGYVWPWVCALIAIAICALLCNRWLPRWPERSKNAAVQQIGDP